jgi:hypothetical protein
MSTDHWPKRTWRVSHVEFNSASPAERDAASAPRPVMRPLGYHYIYSGGKRYKVYDANDLVDRLSDIERNGRPQ